MHMNDPKPSPFQSAWFRFVQAQALSLVGAGSHPMKRRAVMSSVFFDALLLNMLPPAPPSATIVSLIYGHEYRIDRNLPGSQVYFERA